MTKTVHILGATGSVGLSTLKLIEAMPNTFNLGLLAANRSRTKLLELARRYQPRIVSIGSAEDGAWLQKELHGSGVTVVYGEAALLRAIGQIPRGVVVSAIVGAAGLKPTMAAIQAGHVIGLANKESMVVAGQFMTRAAQDASVAILPIDSEHNALHQCLRGEQQNEVKRLILTASGGPFREYTGSMEAITPQQALKHPTWKMGPKITIDSATMMNKGLEVIEAHHLFGFSGKQIDIVVHPQSIVHSLIETVDGSYKAQLGKTDMCDPIQYALTYPARVTHPFEGLDITRGLTLEFFPANREKFPCIQLAYDALAMGGAAPAVLNAANEIAVAAFLQERLSFPGIASLNRRCLDHLGQCHAANLDDLLEIDRQTRALARQWTQTAEAV